MVGRAASLQRYSMGCDRICESSFDSCRYTSKLLLPPPHLHIRNPAGITHKNGSIIWYLTMLWAEHGILGCPAWFDSRTWYLMKSVFQLLTVANSLSHLQIYLAELPLGLSDRGLCLTQSSANNGVQEYCFGIVHKTSHRDMQPISSFQALILHSNRAVVTPPPSSFYFNCGYEPLGTPSRIRVPPQMPLPAGTLTWQQV